MHRRTKVSHAICHQTKRDTAIFTLNKAKNLPQRLNQNQKIQIFRIPATLNRMSIVGAAVEI